MDVSLSDVLPEHAVAKGTTVPQINCTTFIQLKQQLINKLA